MPVTMSGFPQNSPWCTIEHLCADLCRPLDRSQAGVYGKGQAGHLVGALYLQAVVRVIFDGLDPEVIV